MTTLINIRLLSEDLSTVDWGMVKAAAERAQRWEGGVATIHASAPDSAGFKEYRMEIVSDSGVRRIVIGVIKRPGSDDVEFHS